MGLFGFGKKKEEVSPCCSGQEEKAGCGCGGEDGKASCGCGGEEVKADCGCSGEEVKGTCACGGQCGISDIENARFIVLGACCQKSADTFANVKQAVKELGFADEVLNIGDAVEIAKYGVMLTPALVINSKVVSYGKLIKVETAKQLIEKSGIKNE